MNIDFYSENDLEVIESQRKRVNRVIYISLAIYLLFAVASLIYYLGLPYKAKEINTLKLIVFTVSGIFVICFYIFLSIKFKRVKKYHIMLKHLSTGLKETSRGEFVRFDDTVEVKEFVDFKKMITSEWSSRKSEFFERKVLIDNEKPFPDIKVGDMVEYVTQGNILVSYKIVEGE